MFTSVTLYDFNSKDKNSIKLYKFNYFSDYFPKVYEEYPEYKTRIIFLGEQLKYYTFFPWTYFIKSVFLHKCNL